VLRFTIGVLNRRKFMKLVRALFVAAIASGFFLTIAQAKPEYSKKEKKSCTFCHVKVGSKELTAAGKYYKEHDHSLKGYKGEEHKKS
jgi:anaerobic selenocysteine-containing dehydrogenase